MQRTRNIASTFTAKFFENMCSKRDAPQYEYNSDSPPKSWKRTNSFFTKSEVENIVVLLSKRKKNTKTLKISCKGHPNGEQVEK